MGSVALDLQDDKKALRILATDEDYAVLEVKLSFSEEIIQNKSFSILFFYK